MSATSPAQWHGYWGAQPWREHIPLSLMMEFSKCPAHPPLPCTSRNMPSLRPQNGILFTLWCSSAVEFLRRPVNIDRWPVQDTQSSMYGTHHSLSGSYDLASSNKSSLMTTSIQQSTTIEDICHWAGLVADMSIELVSFFVMLVVPLPWLPPICFLSVVLECSAISSIFNYLLPYNPSNRSFIVCHLCGLINVLYVTHFLEEYMYCCNSCAILCSDCRNNSSTYCYVLHCCSTAIMLCTLPGQASPARLVRPWPDQ